MPLLSDCESEQSKDDTGQAAPGRTGNITDVDQRRQDAVGSSLGPGSSLIHDRI